MLPFSAEGREGIANAGKLSPHLPNQRFVPPVCPQRCRTSRERPEQLRIDHRAVFVWHFTGETVVRHGFEMSLRAAMGQNGEVYRSAFQRVGIGDEVKRNAADLLRKSIEREVLHPDAG